MLRPTSLSEPRNALLPVLASQAVATGLMLSGALDYLDWQLLTLVEAWLVHLTLLAWGRDAALPQRAGNFVLVSLVVLPALWLFLSLLATLMLYPDDARAPWTLVFDAVARLGQERLRTALLFLLAGLSVSLLQALRRRDRAAWWARRVVAQYQVNMVATLASLFLLGPLLILRKEVGAIRALPPGVVDGVLLTGLAALRVLVAWRAARLEPPAEPDRR